MHAGSDSRVLLFFSLPLSPPLLLRIALQQTREKA